MTQTEIKRIAGSFRDPSGGVFADAQGRVYRTVNRCAKNVFEQAEATGLPAALEKDGLLLPAHQEDVPRFFLQNNAENNAETRDGTKDEAEDVA